MCSEERGQSHDINALSFISEDTLVSGGINTDLCVYKLDEEGNFKSRRTTEAPEKLKHVIGLPQISNFFEFCEKREFFFIFEAF